MTPTTALEARTVGVLAKRALGRSSAAVVIACFDRCFYLDIGGALITIGEKNLHDGPLNLRLATRRDANLTNDLAIETGQRWMLSPDRLCRTDGLAIELGKAAIWRPKMSTKKPDRKRLADGLAHLRDRLGERDLPEDGLICLVLDLGPPRTPTERAAWPLVQALKAGLPGLLKDDANADLAVPVQLLGLGPGLTPSGDDLLAGLLIAWRQVGATSPSAQLGRVLLTAGKERTTEISLAHLSAAAEGFGAAPVHHLLDALVTDDRRAIPEALDAAAKIGHSSGFDAIAGVMLALSAWLKTENRILTAA